jgi:Zn-dependent metalloprotease
LRFKRFQGTCGRPVQGVGRSNREQIDRVFCRAFTHFLPPNAFYCQARPATIYAAGELYGAGSPAERALTEAWNAVGERWNCWQAPTSAAGGR